jgi:hypothetical protein
VITDTQAEGKKAKGNQPETDSRQRAKRAE